MGILKAPEDVQLLDEVVDDIGFMLHSETKRFGAKCINRMLPKFVGNFNHVPDFCPDPESLGRQKTASTPLLPPIVLRMILIVLLFTELLSENKDKVQEITVSQLFERSKEFPLFILYSLDLLLIHSFRAMAKTVNIFKLAAFKRLGVVQLSVPSTSRKCLHQENNDLKVKDGSERGAFLPAINIKSDTSFNEDIYDRSSDMEEHFEELEVRSQKDQDSDEEETEDSGSSEMSSRGPRLRRLRPRCQMMEEDDFLNSSFSEEDEDEDSEYSEESDDYDEQDWSFPDEDNMDSNVNELKSQNSESSLSCDEVAQSQKDSTRIKIVLAASMPAQAGQTLFVNDETRLHEASLKERRSESESEKVDSSIEGHERSGSADKEKAILNDNDPASSDYIWLRLFVAAYFVDSLLSGIKLITDWLLFSPTFLQHAASIYNFIMQEIASHLASLLNYLSPIVHIVEQELSSDLSMNSEYLGLPVSGIRTPSTLLPHISNNCRELLKREFQQNENFKRVALPEDWLLRGIPSLSSLHKTLDFGTNSLSSRIEETLLRCLALIRFGRKFAKLAEGLGLNFVYHHDVNYFTAPLPSNAATSTSYCRSRCHGGPLRKYAPRRGRRRRKREPYKPRIQSFQALSQRIEDERLCPTSEPHSVTSVDMPTSTSLATREETMRNMAKMRLKNQVDRLSEEMDKRIYATLPSAPFVGQRDSHLPYSPYIVVDTFSLIGNTTFMKRLFASHQYVIIIPRKVIAHLDQLKKTTATARSATRVLEEQTGGGSGYVRIQTEDENPRERIKIRLPKARSNGNEAVDSCADVPVDFSVVSRWAGIIECAIYFSQMSQETSHFRGAEINLAKSVKVVNLLEYQLSATEDVSRAKITVLVGSKLAAPQDLEIPLDLAKLAWESGLSNRLTYQSLTFFAPN
ncbi:unnamed protein product [Hydatigera taeniaeformis]|uniref:PINc domain-containing protein n=1 Tax=Hydatigena taeniaeformis TaxID=6205 RepID=A0A158RDA0_HYDTA|nr:unnamed protein product [Hydatigera taeniaeformis]